jgi:hypothetical protein
MAGIRCKRTQNIGAPRMSKHTGMSQSSRLGTSSTHASKESQLAYLDFWREYYSKVKHQEPSPFALSLNYQGQSIIDLGCGTGRDTDHFALNNRAVGVDMYAPEKYIKMSFNQFFDTHTSRYDIAYCRFVLHAIPEYLENTLLDWCAEHVGELAIECRSSKGQVPSNDHFRRLIDPDKLQSSLSKRGYQIKYFLEDTGLAPYGSEDPVIIRVICRTRDQR